MKLSPHQHVQEVRLSASSGCETKAHLVADDPLIWADVAAGTQSSTGIRHQAQAPSMRRMASMLGEIPVRQINTPEFRAWFGDSKVVDERGNPRVVYHGTTSGPSGEGVFIRGQGFYIYATPDPSYASAFACGPGGKVYPLYARVCNPLDLRSLGCGPDVIGYDLARVLRDAGIEKSWVYSTGTTSSVFNWVKRDTFKWSLVDAGYDGIWLSEKNGDQEADALLVFVPEQIKSAVGNRGTFSPTTPDIRR